MGPDDLKQFPKLSSLEKKSVYQVPDGFYDDLSYSIQLAVGGKSKLSLTDRICKTISIGVTSFIILCIFFMSYCSFSGKSFHSENGNEIASVASDRKDDSTDQGIQYPFSYYFVSAEPIK